MYNSEKLYWIHFRAMLETKDHHQLSPNVEVCALRVYLTFDYVGPYLSPLLRSGQNNLRNVQFKIKKQQSLVIVKE